MLGEMLRVFAIAAAVGTGEPRPSPPQVTPAVQQPVAVPADAIVVVTASRREEQLRNAPATMSVVSDATIDAAPAMNITDLLRHIPGINVSQTSARDTNVTPRAATGTLSDSLLVLLDGRSVYQDFFGAVMWDFLPVGLHEIKQIEVIRGPASAVWGANAMNGVVNVISKTPREMLGTALSVRFGQFDRTPPGGQFDGGGLFAVDVTHAAAPTDRFAYKIAGGFLAQEAFARPSGTIGGSSVPYPDFENRGTRQPRLDARVDYDLRGQRRSLVIAGGITGTEGMYHSGLGPLDVQRGSTFKYGRIAYSRGPLKVRAFVSALDGEIRGALLQTDRGEPFTASFENQAYDLEVANLNVVRSRHVVSYGGNYRYNNFDLSIAPLGTHRQEGGAYIQDEIVFSDRVRWIVGLRLDAFDVLKKAVFSPRTTLLLSPRRDHTVRLSFNRAFRAPSFVNSYLDTRFLTQNGPVVAVGNPSLEEEALTAYEAAYNAVLGRFTGSAAVYLNRLRDSIQFTPVNPDGSRLSYRNFDRITDRGLEVSANLRATSMLGVFANYSWQGRPRSRGVDPSELNVPPLHRVNAGVNGTHGRYFGSVSASFVDEAFWQDVLPQHVGTTDAYTVLDAAVGVHSADRHLTVTARGSNLLNRRVQQHAFGDLIRRTVIGEIQVRF